MSAPVVRGQPNQPLTANIRSTVENIVSPDVASLLDIGNLLKALCQKLDDDPGVTATNFEATFCP